MPPSSVAIHPMHDDNGPRSHRRRTAQQEADEDEEIALKDLLASLLLRADDYSADLLLVGVDADHEGEGDTEGGEPRPRRPREQQIRAHRCILAARSAVFERMLYGPFAEAASRHGESSPEGGERVVRTGFENDVLRAVVEYCYTDRAALFDFDEGSDGVVHLDMDEWARSMVRLCAAADYFRLPGLASSVCDQLVERMTDDDDVVDGLGRGGACRPALACSVLDEAECHGGDGCGGGGTAPTPVTGVGRVHAAAMNVIRSNAVEALLHSLDGGAVCIGVEACGPEAIETILGDGGVMADELTMFRALHRWAEAEVDDDRRREIASGLSERHIHLTRIPSEDLRKVVAPSGLVHPDRLDVALRERMALEEVSRTSDVAPPLPRCRGPGWDASGSSLLECTEPRVTTSLLLSEGLEPARVMTPGSGLHRWSVEVIKLSLGDNDEIGVALRDGIGDPTSWLSRKENQAWVCESRGNAYHGGKCRSVGSRLEFGPGSVVTFALDLRPGPGCGGGGGGRLSASVDGGTTWAEMFDNMMGDDGGRRRSRRRIQSLDDGGEDGDGDGETLEPISFVPAVSLYHGASVRFLGFETTGQA